MPHMQTLLRGRTLIAAVAAATLAVGGLTLAPSAQAATNPYERGPAPTLVEVERYYSVAAASAACWSWVT